jgi:hypothetical protein
LPFEVECPKCGEGRLATRRARRTGNVFWGCSRYPDCDYTTNMEPVGANHDADAGPVALKDEQGICLRCGAAIDLPADRSTIVGSRLAGGPPNLAALAPSRKRRAGGRKGKSQSKAGSSGGRKKAASSSDEAEATPSGEASQSGGSGDPPSLPTG